MNLFIDEIALGCWLLFKGANIHKMSLEIDSTVNDKSYTSNNEQLMHVKNVQAFNLTNGTIRIVICL